MPSSLFAFLMALILAVTPNLARAQDDPGAMSSQTSSSTSSGGSDAASTNAESTAQIFISPFEATESGVASSSEWTSAQFAASATAIGVVILLLVLVAAILIAIGVGVYLSVKAKAGEETAFRRFLRMNRQALQQQVVAGHGPVLMDFATMFGVKEAYPGFAALVRDNEHQIRALLTEDAVEAEGPSALSHWLVTALLAEPSVLEEWIANNRVSWTLKRL